MALVARVERHRHPAVWCAQTVRAACPVPLGLCRRRHWPRAAELGVKLITGARVRRIALDARGRADGAVWIDREGREHLQLARVVILAANGIGTPRLLLLSATRGHEAGLANSSGLVGK